MATNRINITIDDETLAVLDVMADEYGMCRSECIRFMVEAMDGLAAWSVLQRVGVAMYAERFGRAPESGKVSPAMMLRAAGECSIVVD